MLSNLESSAEARSPPATPPDQLRSVSPDEKMILSQSKDSADAQPSSKDAEPEAKKRKRSQRACIRCRGQKLKCDGVFPCARCLKLKLVCKEPSEANAGTPTSHRVNQDDRDSKASSGPYAFSLSTRPHSQASDHLAVSGLPSHPAGSHYASSSTADGVFSDRSRHANHTHAPPQHRDAFNLHPSDRFAYSLPDAVRRIENLERTVSRLVETVEAHSGSYERPGSNSLARPSSSRSAASPNKHERKRPRADSPDESDAEVDELQDGASEASVPLQALSHHEKRNSRDALSTEAQSAPIQASNEAAAPRSSSSATIHPSGSRPYSNGIRHTSAHDPIEAGFITIEMGQMLLDV